MNLRIYLRIALMVLLPAWATLARADLTVDWGTVATPLSSEVTFSFAQYDINRNFTDHYNFSLEGGNSASYSVTFNFDPCRNGCGSPDLSFGIYDLNGSLISSTGGTITLSAGNYTFQVKGNGFGAGNSVDYWGSITFAASGSSPTNQTMVSPAPEPSTLILMAAGLLVFAWKARRHAAAGLAGLAALATLPACSPFETSASATPGQVIARVGGSEISMLQFNHAIERMGIPNPGQPVRQEVATKLVDRELAVQQALAQKLDRQPEVMLQIEEARRDVLARAYAERTAATAARPDDNTLARYYAQHPALFAERKIFRLREVVLPADLKEMAEVKQRLVERQPLDKITAWLRAQNPAFNEQVVIRAAEQLPIEALPRLNKAQEGETVVFESPRGVIAYVVMSAQPAGVTWESAKPIVRDHLVKRAGKEVVDTRLRELRSQTAIAYLGDFAAAPPTATQ
ncbi:MAG: EpsD family peptidyl-prolyl cis-trans isomerase [Rhodocyclaceae bacterium]|nr:EpsD family peptidyl-prolyl cis-trans isomerase [Rhodocyclaceae bacterium]MDZ4216484.1 EpsD family peptidyl-prolyl cis-trans isomerase [Rhodocyclaceae bacterium]